MRNVRTDIIYPIAQKVASEPTELLGKIEEMVSGNSGAHFKIDRKILQEMEEIREIEERAKTQQMKAQKQWELCREKMGEFILYYIILY